MSQKVEMMSNIISMKSFREKMTNKRSSPFLGSSSIYKNQDWPYLVVKKWLMEIIIA